MGTEGITAMKALTLWQPWASLMAVGAKRIETRSWRTNYRGPLAIHAALRSSLEAGALEATIPVKVALAGEIVLGGCIVAVVNLCACRKITETSPLGLSAQEKAFGDYTPGRFAWVTDSVRRLPEPIPCRGRQGLWELPPEIAARLDAR